MHALMLHSITVVQSSRGQLHLFPHFAGHVYNETLPNIGFVDWQFPIETARHSKGAATVYTNTRSCPPGSPKAALKACPEAIEGKLLSLLVIRLQNTCTRIWQAIGQ